jgi:sensor histidine kinase regulating citrate/malate metabolism
VALPKVLELVYEDDGDGVTDANRPLIMLHGFTTAEIAKDKGRGLSLISRQLSEYGGHIEPMAARHGVKGARFVIRFGLINNSHVTAREVTHAGIPNCVG